MKWEREGVAFIWDQFVCSLQCMCVCLFEGESEWEKIRKVCHTPRRYIRKLKTLNMFFSISVSDDIHFHSAGAVILFLLLLTSKSFCIWMLIENTVMKNVTKMLYMAYCILTRTLNKYSLKSYFYWRSTSMYVSNNKHRTDTHCFVIPGRISIWNPSMSP